MRKPAAFSFFKVKLFSLILAVACGLYPAYAQNAQILFKEGTALIKNGEYELAAQKLEEAAKIDPEDNGVICNLAVAYAYRGDMDKAIEQLEKAAYREPSPSRGILFYNLANLYHIKGDIKEAELNYSNSLYILPFFAQPYLQLGMLFLSSNDQARAKEFISKANSMDSSMPDIRAKPIKEERVGYTIMTLSQKAMPQLYLYHSPNWYL
jgi:tetratricopeptide (TPR) repeat protein